MMASVASFLLLGFAARATASASLSMNLLGPSEVTDVDTFTVTAAITNTGDESLRLYKDPRSALHDFPENTFMFSCPEEDDATPPPFIGAKVKYELHAATEFVTLGPGETLNVTHRLAEAYNFTAPGSYEIDALRLFHYYDPTTASATSIYATIPSSHTAKLGGSLVSTIVAERRELARRAFDVAAQEKENNHLEKRARFSSCSTSQQSQVQAALPTTMTYISNAVGYLQGLSSGKKRYTKWFGTYSSSRKTTVLSHFKKIQSSDPRTYQYSCVCSLDAYAYVHSDTPKVVYLCASFWTAPTTGTDSKAGSIVHEASHFTINGGTDDYAYGQDRAAELALSSPSQAIFNADNHEYFAENKPSLT